MPIIIIGIILIAFGLLAIYSVSIHESFTLTLKLIANGNRTGDPSNYFYFLRQLKNIAIAVIIALGVYILPLKFFQKNRNIVIIAVILMVLQIFVFVPGIGMELNGARGWISLPFFPSIQPAEFFKLGYVFFFSSRLLKKRDIINQKQFFSNFIVINILLLGIFLLIPDLGTLLILGLTSLTLCRYIGTKLKYILYLLGGALISGILMGSIAGMISPKFDYIQKRFTYFLDSSVDEQKRGVGRQNQQALIAVGGGGLFGKGYGKGLQKFGYIPEAQSDFIFAAYSEEIGFVGNIALLSLYFYLAYYFLSRLHTIKNEYNKTIGVGIIALIMIQVFVNIGVNVKIMPNTGLTLPFISYGGTALMVNCIEIILLYKILKEK
ncbi:Stage V sporulation protein E [candidate division SR1 bacterium RAAC1_SR1_1]|nr:Stage V sporulation protein E [candidate division SR1 bacterium RAAC1_SR1_1]